MAKMTEYYCGDDHHDVHDDCGDGMCLIYAFTCDS